MQTCLLCGSADLEMTGIYLFPDGEHVAVYHLCGDCWQLGHVATALLAEAALAGVFETMN